MIPEPASNDAPSARSMTALSVNLNKVALVRNTRHLGVPSIVRAAAQCLAAGAHGITVHPRPDARHIRVDDVHELHAMLRVDWPQVELNIEGNPFHNLMDFVRQLRPAQATFVPDSEGQFTSDHGWSFPEDAERLRPLIAEARALGVRVSLFMDPLPQAMAAVRDLGAERIELYTESYAASRDTPAAAPILQSYVAAAQAAQALGIEVNAGHDLCRENLTQFLRAVLHIREVSIGHAFIADALELGYAATTREYLACIDAAAEPAPGAASSSVAGAPF